MLVATHWGWVHVAELTANSIEGRGNAVVEDRRRQWLSTIQPYTRFEINTRVEDDGSITIYRVASPSGREWRAPVHVRPRASTTRRSTRPTSPPRRSPSAPSCSAAQAAQDTERERERYQIAADAYESVLLDDADEQQRRLAQRAASEALSNQINSNLRDPPLLE